MNGLPASRFYKYSSSCLYLILYSEKKIFVKYTTNNAIFI